MKKEKMTDWIPFTTLPTFPGFYERDWEELDGDTLTKDRDYWDGYSWYYWDKENAKTDGKAPNNRRWRGLAEDPNKKDEA